MGFVFGPSWFYGLDAVFEFVAMLVTLFIAVYSFRIYLIAHEKRYFYFTLAFASIAASFAIRAVADYLAYSSLLGRIPNVVSLVSNVATVPALHSFAYLMYVFLILAGFMILVAIFMRIDRISVLSLLFVFILILTALSQSIFIALHLTLFVMLAYIVLHLFGNHRRIKNVNSFLVLYSMSGLLAAQVFFMLTGLDKLYYVVGHCLQLAGFLILLGNMVLVLRR